MSKKRLLGGSFNKVILLFFQRKDVMDVMDANDENVGLFGVFSGQAASHMEARKDKALTWVLDARKSEEYRAAKTHVARLLAQGRRSRITKGYDRSEHECPWFMDLLYDLVKDVMQVKQQHVVQDDNGSDSCDSNDSNSCDSNENDQDKPRGFDTLNVKNLNTKELNLFKEVTCVLALVRKHVGRHIL
jgi:hypothetical protein